jgi:two-component system chemotaxis response regulator CheB
MAQDGLTLTRQVLLIGGSAGSLEVVLQLLPQLKLPAGIAVILVLHRKNSESLLPDLLAGKTMLPVKEAEDKEWIQPGTIYIAPADYHLLIEADKSFSLDASEKVHYSRPSIDVTFEMAAEVYGPSVIALLLSGANADGAEGMKKVKEAGGLTLVQDPASASVSYMPEQAIKTGSIDYIVPVPKLAALINHNLG